MDRCVYNTSMERIRSATHNFGNMFRSACGVDLNLFLRVTVFGSLSALTACGSRSGTSAPPVNPGPAPAVTAISPNSSTQGGPPFTLSVVGSNFASDSTVHWNGAAEPTTFVKPNLLTAAIPALETANPGPDNVTVVDTGGTS